MDVANCSRGAPGCYAERLREVNLGSDVDFSAGCFDVYKLFVVKPGLNSVRRNAQANAIPFFILKRDKLCGLVVSGIVVVDIRQAADAATPATKD